MAEEKKTEEKKSEETTFVPISTLRKTGDVLASSFLAAVLGTLTAFGIRMISAPLWAQIVGGAGVGAIAGGILVVNNVRAWRMYGLVLTAADETRTARASSDANTRALLRLLGDDEEEAEEKAAPKKAAKKAAPKKAAPKKKADDEVVFEATGTD